MKNFTYSLFTLIIISLFLFTACDTKENEPPIIVCPPGDEVSHISKLNLQVEKNSNLEYLIGMDDIRNYQIINSPYNAETSVISPLKTNPIQFVYNYTPKQDFVGKDSVAIIIKTPDITMEYPSSDIGHVVYLILDIKDELEDNNIYTVNASIPNGNTYEFFLGSNLQGYKYTIVKKPLNAELSDIITSDDKTHEIFYNYIPKKRFTGKDYVEIERMKPSTALSGDDMGKRIYCISIEVI